MKTAAFVAVTVSAVAIGSFAWRKLVVPTDIRPPPPLPFDDSRFEPLDPAKVRRAALDAALPGGSRVPILEEGLLIVPAGMTFVPRKEAMMLLAVTGKGPTPETVGMLFTTSPESAWSARLEWHAVGAVRVPDGTKWDAEREMARMRATEQRDNPSRVDFQITTRDWLEAPSFDPKTHTFRFGIRFSTKTGVAEPLEMSYRACKFGRSGYLEITVVDDAQTAPSRVALARASADAFDFAPGHRYEDFVPGRDRTGPDALGLKDRFAGRCY